MTPKHKHRPLPCPSCGAEDTLYNFQDQQHQVAYALSTNAHGDIVYGPPHDLVMVIDTNVVRCVACSWNRDFSTWVDVRAGADTQTT